MDPEELIAEIRSIEAVIAEAAANLVDGLPGMPDEDLSSLTQTHQSLISQLAAMPKEYEKLKVWVLEIRGSVDTFPDLDKWNPSDFEVEDIDRISSLAQNIRVFMTEKGFPITDSGFNNESWHIGVWCTEKESQEVHQVVSTKFNKAIKSGLVTIHKIFWDYRLPVLEGEE